MANDPAFLTQRELAQREIDRQVLEGMITQEEQDIIDDRDEFGELVYDYWEEIIPLMVRQVVRFREGAACSLQTNDLARKVNEIIKARAKVRSEQRLDNCD